MSNQRADPVSARVDRKLASLSNAHSDAYIFKVDEQLRRENKQAYEPEILAIGPYHHDKENVQKMEEHKLRYLQLLLRRRNESSVDRYVTELRELEENARKCFAEFINFDKDKFVEMMLLDGFFIIELFRKVKMNYLIDVHDPIFRFDRTKGILRHDLLLFENQLPFFILVKLFNMTIQDNNHPIPQDNIIDIALYFFKHALLDPLPLQHSARISIDNVNHLLGLVHDSWCSSFAEMVRCRNNTNRVRQWEFIKCTVELREAGIKFNRATEASSLLDIKFENGIMEIPLLIIEERIEIILRNLIAYEQYYPTTKPAYVTDYMTFLSCLITTAKDAEKLRHYGIIDNWFCDDEAVATMFNKLGNAVDLHLTFCYAEVFNKVNDHCRQRRHIWIAKLMRNYFNSPWAFISFLGAIVLLLLTLLQTVFSILSYGR